MCLLINQLKPKITDKDIICYKLVYKTKIKGIYKAANQDFEYIIRQSYTNNIDIKNIIFRIYPGPFNMYSIEEGMFHSYVNNLNNANFILNNLPNYTALKCIIPKGAYYYIGMCGSNLSYASSQIKILEEI